MRTLTAAAFILWAGTYGTSPRTVPRSQFFEGLTGVAVVVILGYFVYLVWRMVYRNPDAPEVREVVKEIQKRRRAERGGKGGSDRAATVATEAAAESRYFLRGANGQREEVTREEARELIKSRFPVEDENGDEVKKV